ncbi:hypothetical protein SAY87_003959 [Trapa incisa]|uniref:Single-stranded DNA-binding protein n=1 Tax=Trapa incisa TaxID=236973 RepID=A0AAN7JN65_9MYRT|nr:hypothetical protein SAY87_003959 [Trapa incisa]
MTSSMAALVRRLPMSLRPATIGFKLSIPFCTKGSSLEIPASDESNPESDADSRQSSQSSSQDPVGQRSFYDRPLENGLDVGVYKAIIVGQVGQPPVQKTLKSGTRVTLLSVGTGGIRNNRRPLQNEDPKEYANRCSVQWHRVSVYAGPVGDVVMKHAIPGSILYAEGNLETKIFTDPITGLVRRVREIAIRRNGTLTSFHDVALSSHMILPKYFTMKSMSLPLQD